VNIIFKDMTSERRVQKCVTSFVDDLFLTSFECHSILISVQLQCCFNYYVRISYLPQPDLAVGPCVGCPWHVGQRDELVQLQGSVLPKYKQPGRKECFVFTYSSFK